MKESEEAKLYPTWRDHYLVIQGFFYLSQGIAMGVTLFFAEFLRQLGVSDLNSIIFQAIVVIPWYIKIVFGILSDNIAISDYGRRKPYIFVAGFFALIGWLTMPLYDTFSILVLLSGFLVSLGIAVSDASIDALAVDITPPNRRGSMQGVSWGSRGLGFGVASFVAGSLVDQADWLLLFIVPGILTGLACFLVLLIEEKPLPDDFKKVPVEIYKQVFSHRAIHLTLIFQIFSGAGITIVALLQTFLDEELAYTNTDVGRILLYFAIGMLIGAVSFGILGDRIRVRIILPIATALYILTIISIFMVDLDQFGQISIYFGVVGLINGGYEATQMRLGMDYATTVLGGTMFNLYNSISNIGQFALGSIIIFSLTQILDLKVSWQFTSIFLLIAIIPAILLLKNYDSYDVERIGRDLISENQTGLTHG